MQQTSGSSFSNRTDDETDGDKSAVDEVAVDEVAVVVFFLLMVCDNC